MTLILHSLALTSITAITPLDPDLRTPAPPHPRTPAPPHYRTTALPHYRAFSTSFRIAAKAGLITAARGWAAAVSSRS